MLTFTNITVHEIEGVHTIFVLVIICDRETVTWNSHSTFDSKNGVRLDVFLSAILDRNLWDILFLRNGCTDLDDFS